MNERIIEGVPLPEDVRMNALCGRKHWLNAGQ